MPSSEVFATADAYVNQSQPDQSYGQRPELILNNSGGSEKRGLIYVRLPMPDLMMPITIQQAVLHVHLKGAWAGANTVTVKRINGTWAQSVLSWNNQPTTDALHSGSASVTAGVDAQELEIDVTQLVQDGVNGMPFFGFELTVGTSSDRELSASDDPDAGLRPWLEVEWSAAPLAPTNLAPDGGRAVSAAKPILPWQYSDEIGESTQAYAKVQVNSTDDFSGSVDFDSGWVATNDPFLDLSTTSFGAMSEGQQAYWRVAVKDDSGIASDYSDVASFKRHAGPTLSLVNPPVAPNNYVDELTPPIDWTYSGTASRQVVVLKRVNDDGSKTELYRTDVPTTDTLWKIPAQGNKHRDGTFPGLRSGRTYEISVTVWDDKDREATPNDPGYQRVTRQFTYQRVTPWPDSVDSLVLESNGPGVILHWHRTLEPDFFCIKVKDREMVHHIVPEDVRNPGSGPYQGAGWYKYTYWGQFNDDEWRFLPLGQDWWFEVEAVVNNAGKLKHSKDNPVKHITIEPYAMWVVDPDNGDIVKILGTSQPDLAVGSSGTTYDPLGARKPVRIIDNVRGLEGSLSGWIKSSEDRNTLYDIYGRMKEVRLIIYDVNIPVEFSDPPAIAHTPDAVDVMFPVTLNFFQTGEFSKTVGLRG